MLDAGAHGRVYFPNDVLERSVPLEAAAAESKHEHPAFIPMYRLPAAVAAQQQELADMRDEWAAKAALQLMTGDGRRLFHREWETEEALYHLAREILQRLNTETYRRWSNAFSCFCFVLVGAPLAVWRRNSDYLTTFFICFFPILLVYYPLLMLGVDQAKSGRVPPATVWLGNVVLLAASVPLLRRMIRY
jgi:lipopolysaccharide export system permease protein